MSYRIVILFFLLSAAFAQVPVVDRDPTLHTQQILQQARQSIGNLNLQSFSARAKIQRRVKYVEVSSPTEVEEKEKTLTSKLKIEFVWPDKFRVREKGTHLTGQSYEFTAIVNGTEAWIHPLPVVPSTPENRRVVSVEDAQQNLIRQAQTARANISRFTLSWFLSAWSTWPVEFTFAGRINTEAGVNDVLSVRDADGYKLLLLLDPTTRLPVMLNETLVLPQRVTVIPTGFGFDRRYNRAIFMKAREERTARFKPAQPISIQLRLSDRRNIGGLNLPHRFTTYHNGQQVEEIEFDDIKLNPPIHPKKFEEHRPR